MSPLKSYASRVVEACLLLNLAGTCLAEDQAILKPAKKVTGQELTSAKQARDQADRMWSGLRREVRAARSGNAGNPEIKATNAQSPEAVALQSRVDEVIDAYRTVIKKYPGTDIAVYCELRLSGVYQQLGKPDKAVEVLEKAADEFAGTHEGINVALNLGLIEAQGRHDPVAATKWFNKVPLPKDTADPAYESMVVLYFSSQQQLIKAELDRGLQSDAEARVKKFREDLPKQADELDRFYKSEMESRRAKASNSASKSPAK
jgi:hypothetical protein